MLDCDVEVNRRNFTVVAAFRLQAGQRLALFGPSGAGKTTVLEAIAGLVPIRRGAITLEGRVLSRAGAAPLPAHLRRVGLVRQQPSLFPHMTVEANLRFGCCQNDTRYAEVVERLGLAELLGARPPALSGGQRQRVAFARTLLSPFAVLLLDEPYTGLDAALRASLHGLVADTVALQGIPAILVSHDLPEAQAFGDRVAIIDRGRVLQVDGPAQIVAEPASRRVAELVGYRAFVDAQAVPGCGPGVVGVHPERLRLGAHRAHGPVVTGRVTAVRPHGPRWQAQVVLDVGPGLVPPGLVALLPDYVAIGERVVLTLLAPPLFDRDGASAGLAGDRPGASPRQDRARGAGT